MCGICGFWDLKGKDVTGMLKKSLLSIKHRGPDGTGVYVKSNVFWGDKIDLILPEADLAIGHVLLQIVGGLQPISNEANSIWIVHNGEIYNHLSLRKKLKEKGHVFRSSSDSEVLLHLYEENNFEPILGDYAFAIYDNNIRQLFLARDPIGIRPLFYCFERGIFGFCSERKGLRIHCEEIKELKPGESLVFSHDGLSLNTFKKLPEPQSIFSPNTPIDVYVRELENALVEAVEIMGYHNAGLAFSGGIDSTIIALILKERGYEPILYTTGSSDSQDIINARKAARELKLELEVVSIGEEDILEIIPEVVYHVEDWDPVKISIAIPLYLTFRKMREDGVIVAFSGQGADELFGGYARYLESRNPERDMMLDFSNLHTRNLNRDDHVSMASAVEVRYPYLYDKVVSLAFSIPLDYKIRNGVRKFVLRELLKKLLPKSKLYSIEKKAVQYGSGTMKILRKIARKKGEKVSDFLKKVYGDVFSS